MNFLSEQLIFDGTAAVEAAFTAATTDILTSNAHGFSGGEMLQFTTSTTLPAGLSLTTTYFVVNPTTNTFQLSATPGGAIVDVTDTGTGTHTFHLKGRAILTKGFRHILLSLASTGSGNFTCKVQSSRGEDMPDFETAASITNVWDYTLCKDTENADALEGDTGYVLSGTDDIKNYAVNIDGASWVCMNFTAWTAGKLRAGITLSN